MCGFIDLKLFIYNHLDVGICSTVHPSSDEFTSPNESELPLRVGGFALLSIVSQLGAFRAGVVMSMNLLNPLTSFGWACGRGAGYGHAGAAGAVVAQIEDLPPCERPSDGHVDG